MTPLTMPDEPLPRLVSRGDVMREMGISQRQADHIFRQLGVIRLPGSSRSYVKAADVHSLLRVVGPLHQEEAA